MTSRNSQFYYFQNVIIKQIRYQVARALVQTEDIDHRKQVVALFMVTPTLTHPPAGIGDFRL
jgi:hypothetical protein